MNDFFDKADQVLTATGGEDRTRWSPLDWTRHVRASLQSVHSKSELDIFNLESVWGALELGRLVGRFPGLDENEISDAVKNLKECIGHTLEKSIRFRIDDSDLSARGGYKPFVKLVKALNEHSSCTIITFNYDVALDIELYRQHVACDYHLDRSESKQTPLLKLHGSLNWVHCTKCGTGQACRPERLLVAARKSKTNPDKSLLLDVSDISRREATPCQCGGESRLESLLIPPTWNKSFVQPQINNVWRRAARELGSAKNIVVAGYSLPETDSFVRYLLALGLSGDLIVERFLVFDPNLEVRARFEGSLGLATKQRFTFHQMPFEKVAEQLARDFKVLQSYLQKDVPKPPNQHNISPWS